MGKKYSHCNLNLVLEGLETILLLWCVVCPINGRIVPTFSVSTSHPAPADFTWLIIPTGAPHQSILQISHTSLQYVIHRLFKTIGLQFRDP
jgi:hypothetical protein